LIFSRLTSFLADRLQGYRQQLEAANVTGITDLPGRKWSRRFATMLYFAFPATDLLAIVVIHLSVRMSTSLTHWKPSVV
jgi:hypothetical protein